MAEKITTEELKNKLDNNEDFYLIDALSENSFEAKHIPGAKNVPNSSEFLEQFENEIAAEKDAEIITYCSSSSCMASVQAAETLEKAGYTNVKHYAEGIAGWEAAGHDFEGAAA